MSYSRPTPAATAGLTPTFITYEKAAACAPTCTKSARLLEALSERSKCVGIMFALRQGLLVVIFTVTETYCCPVLPTPSDPYPLHTSQLVFLFQCLGSALQLLAVQDRHLQLWRWKGQRVKPVT